MEGIVLIKTKDDLGKLVEGNWVVDQDGASMVFGSFGRGGCFYEAHGDDSIMCVPLDYTRVNGEGSVTVVEDGFGLERDSKEYFWAKHLLSNNISGRMVA